MPQTKNLWLKWREFVGEAVTLLASFASIASLLVYFLPPKDKWPWWIVPLMIFGGVTFLIALLLLCLDQRGRHVYSNADTTGIKKYMHRWISHGGRVAIWTRDLSWVADNETKDLLLRKAARKELILCIPTTIQIATELTNAGAEVCIYGRDLLESPSSRFTIAFFERAGSRVAVGRAEGDAHVIEEFSAGSHPAYHMAVDLIKLARAVSAYRKE